MPSEARYVFIASMDVDPEHEDLFNEVYDTEHVPKLLEVPGVRAVMRYTRETLSMSMGGQVRTIEAADEPKYSAVYEIDDPKVLVSPEWAAAVEAGRWPEQVRPHTKNRRHVLRKLL
jgi:hypothetical protein